MLHLIQKILLITLFSLTLQAQSGLSQKHLVSLSPEVSAQEVSTNTSIEIKFDLSILSSSLKKRTITLKSQGKKVHGVTTIKNSDTLLFTPDEELTTGEYKVKVKKIKLQDSSYENLKGFKKFAYKLCSYFYDDVKKCPLCKYLCNVQTKKITYSFNVDGKQPNIISLTLNKSNIQLNEDNTTTINVDAKYDNNETIDVTNEVEWITSDSNIISINKNVITPIKEGTTTLQAKFKSKTTEEISITVYKEINGYKLPPEPDKTINNSTLLGIDVNGNGVRDDVERWIYTYYSKPIEHAVFMQSARAYQIVIQEPEKALETMKYLDAVSNCESYWRMSEEYAKSINEPFWLEEYKNYDMEINPIQFSTADRFLAYDKYNQTLSGGVYDDGLEPSEWKYSCDFNTTTLLKNP